MPIVLTQYTKEYVPVDIKDRTGATTDMSVATPVFSILDDNDVALYDDETAVGESMRISCLVDTSATHPSGAWIPGHYRMFVGFTVGDEVVKLGPIDLYVVSGYVT
jgi:hypothetical protein